MRELETLKASELFSFPAEVREALLSYKQAFVINDVFYDHFLTWDKINLLYGGYGSGKSNFVAQDLIEKSRIEKYFKCYYGRKVFDTVRGSCFETLYENIESLGLKDEFKYSTADNSSMIITHKETGNKFVPFGADKADKLKSIKDPTHIWCEEFDQFEDGDPATGKKGDFALLFPRLRTQKAKTQFYATFNTDPVHSSHWIMKHFFPEMYSGKDKMDDSVLDGLSVKKVFANYTDNYFINQDEYYNQLKLAAAGNATILDAIARGAWGSLLNDNPWLFAWDTDKHTKERVDFIPSYPIYVFIDVNNDPFEATLWQMSPHKGQKDSFLHCFDMFSGKHKATDLGQKIKAKYPSSIMYLGGDRSGQNEDVGRNQTIYSIIGGALGLHEKQLLLQTHNLTHADSRMLCNTMLSNYPNTYICKEKCSSLITQCEKARVDTKSSTPHKLLKDRGEFKNDAFDSMRYMYQTCFNDFARSAYFKVPKQ